MCTAFYNKEHHPAFSEAVENGTETPQKDSVQEMRDRGALGKGKASAEGISVLLPWL